MTGKARVEKVRFPDGGLVWRYTYIPSGKSRVSVYTLSWRAAVDGAYARMRVAP